jgi:hypothetical protein
MSDGKQDKLRELVGRARTSLLLSGPQDAAWDIIGEAEAAIDDRPLMRPHATIDDLISELETLLAGRVAVAQRLS